MECEQNRHVPKTGSAIAAEKVAKNFVEGERMLPVLSGVDLTLVSGEAVAILGVSGTGKSTLPNVLGGLDSAESGSVIVGGVDLRSAGAADLARFRAQRIGFIFQFYNLIPETYEDRVPPRGSEFDFTALAPPGAEILPINEPVDEPQNWSFGSRWGISYGNRDIDLAGIRNLTGAPVEFTWLTATVFCKSLRRWWSGRCSAPMRTGTRDLR